MFTKFHTAGLHPACGQEEPYDLVIGADVLYRQEHLEALLHTLLQVLKLRIHLCACPAMHRRGGLCSTFS